MVFASKLPPPGGALFNQSTHCFVNSLEILRFYYFFTSSLHVCIYQGIEFDSLAIESCGIFHNLFFITTKEMGSTNLYWKMLQFFPCRKWLQALDVKKRCLFEILGAAITKNVSYASAWWICMENVNPKKHAQAKKSWQLSRSMLLTSTLYMWILRRAHFSEKAWALLHTLRYPCEITDLKH